MSTPSTAITRFDLSIGYDEFDQLANEKRYICLKALPPLGVSQEAADFYKLDLANSMAKVIDTTRAPRAAYRRETYEWQKDSYSLTEHGVEEVVDDAEVEKYGDILRLEQRAVRRVTMHMLTKLEADAAAALFNTTTWTGLSLTTALATPWSTRATADPLSDIDAARAKVQDNSGESPNTLICSDKAFTALIRTSRIEDLLKGNAITSPILMDAQQQPGLASNSEFMGALCGLLRLDRILVGRGFYNNANRGVTPVGSSFWSNTMAMVAYIKNDGMNGDLESTEPQLGRTLFSTKNGEPIPGTDASDSLIFEEYREENTRGGVHRARNKRQQKIFYTGCGHLLTNVT